MRSVHRFLDGDTEWNLSPVFKAEQVAIIFELAGWTYIWIKLEEFEKIVGMMLNRSEVSSSIMVSYWRWHCLLHIEKYYTNLI